VKRKKDIRPPFLTNPVKCAKNTLRKGGEKLKRDSVMGNASEKAKEVTEIVFNRY